jgi:hypothetical protein
MGRAPTPLVLPLEPLALVLPDVDACRSLLPSEPLKSSLAGWVGKRGPSATTVLVRLSAAARCSASPIARDRMVSASAVFR